MSRNIEVYCLARKLNEGFTAIDNRVIKEYKKDPNYEGGAENIKLFSIDCVLGEVTASSNPPRKRGILIGLAKDSSVVIGYPKGVEHSDAYHATCEYEVIKILGVNNTETVLRAYIWPEHEEPTRTSHTISIHKLNSADEGTQPFTLSCQRSSRELGYKAPERFLNKELANKLMSALYANKVEVIADDSSLKTYGSKAMEKVQTI